MKELDYSSLVKDIREQLEISQEDLAKELGVSFATVNRWEKGQYNPSKLALTQFIVFCKRMAKQNKITLPPEFK